MRDESARSQGEVFGFLAESGFSSSSLPAPPGELNSRLSSDTSLMSQWLSLNANILLRSLVKVVGLYYFMLQVSPRLTFLSLLDLPLTIAAEKVYNPRHQVCVHITVP